MLSCNQVTRLSASEDLRRAPLATRFAVRLHLLMCRHCRRYVKELAAIGLAARKVVERASSSAIDTLALERRILTEAERLDDVSRGTT